jgi:hypothetical protein
MKLSKSLFVIPVASLVFAVAVGAGACSSSVTINTPKDSASLPTTVVLPNGWTSTTSCDDGTFVEISLADGTDAWLLCEDGTWSGYTETDPAGESGWSAYDGTVDGGSFGDLRPVGDGGGSDAVGSEAGGNDGGSPDATGGDATTEDGSSGGGDATAEDGGASSDSGSTGSDSGSTGSDSGTTSTDAA